MTMFEILTKETRKTLFEKSIDFYLKKSVY